MKSPALLLLLGLALPCAAASPCDDKPQDAAGILAAMTDPALKQRSLSMANLQLDGATWVYYVGGGNMRSETPPLTPLRRAFDIYCSELANQAQAAARNARAIAAARGRPAAATPGNATPPETRPAPTPTAAAERRVQGDGIVTRMTGMLKGLVGDSEPASTNAGPTAQECEQARREAGDCDAASIDGAGDTTRFRCARARATIKSCR